MPEPELMRRRLGDGVAALAVRMQWLGAETSAHDLAELGKTKVEHYDLLDPYMVARAVWLRSPRPGPAEAPSLRIVAPPVFGNAPCREDASQPGDHMSEAVKKAGGASTRNATAPRAGVTGTNSNEPEAGQLPTGEAPAANSSPDADVSSLAHDQWLLDEALARPFPPVTRSRRRCDRGEA